MSDRAFLFADLAGFTALTEAHGDLDAAAVAARFAQMAREVLRTGCALVKTMGDAVMVVAEDPGEVVSCCLDLAALIDKEPMFPALRAGIHAGPAVSQGDDWFGASVNLAARVAAHARSGQTLCTESIAAAAGSVEIAAVRPVGKAHFKNVSESVDLYEISDRRRAAVSDEVDLVCHMTIDPSSAPARLPFDGRTLFFCSFECARAFAERPGAYTRA